MATDEIEAAKYRAADLTRVFIAGPDRSVGLAVQIENLLNVGYPEDPELQDLVISLACYRPEGGPHLYSEPEMIDLLSRHLPKMSSGAYAKEAQDKRS
jgi:hypothetical protein